MSDFRMDLMNDPCPLSFDSLTVALGLWLVLNAATARKQETFNSMSH